MALDQNYFISSRYFPVQFSYRIYVSRSLIIKTRKLSYRKKWPRDAPYMCVPWKISTVPEYADGYFSGNFNKLLFRLILLMCVQNLKFVALPVHEIKGGTQKRWARPRSLFSQNVNGLLFGWTLWMYRPNLQSVALPTPEIIAIAGLGWGCEPQSRGKGSRMGSGMVPFERALVSSYRASIVTFHLSLCVSEILLLLCSTTPLATAWDLISVRSELVLLDNGCVLFQI